MMTLPTRSARPTARVLRGVTLVTVLALVTLAGCDRSNRNLAAIRQAQTEVDVLTGGGHMTAVPASVQEEKYKKVLADLKPIVDGGGADAAPAAAVSARAELGLAALEVANATTGEKNAVELVDTARNALSRYVGHAASAAAAAKADLSGEIAKLDADAKAADTKIADTKAAQQKAEAQIAELNKQADGLLAQAKAKRELASTTRQGMNNVSATEALAVLEKATAISREADALDQQAADVHAEVVSLEPAAAQAALDVVSAQHDRELIDSTKQTTLQQMQLYKEQAAGDRASTDKDAKALADALTALAKTRTDEAAKAWDAADAHYKKALTLANKAAQAATAQADKQVAAAAKGAVLQAQGDSLLKRAAGYRTYQSILDQTTAASPDVPQKAEYVTASKSAGEQADAAFKAAVEAYTQATSAYNPDAAKSEDAKARYQRTVELLKQISSGNAAPGAESDVAAKGDKPEANEKPETPAPAPVPERAPVAAAEDTGSAPQIAAVKARLNELLAKARAKDTMAILNAVDAHAGIEGDCIDDLKAFFAGRQELEDACQKTLNKSLQDLQVDVQLQPELVAAVAGVGNVIDLTMAAMFTVKDLHDISADNFTYKLVAPNAVTIVPRITVANDYSKKHPDHPAAFVLVDGVWKIGFGDTTSMEFKRDQPAFPFLRAVGKAYSETAADVTSGKLTEAHAIFSAMADRITAVAKQFPVPGLTDMNK